MRAEYKSLQRQADHLQHRMQDCIDNGSDPVAQKVARMARDVMEEIESDKPPRAIESRIVQLKQRLEEIKGHPTPVMSPQDARTLQDDYEDLRREARSLPDY
jgi:phage shock protein A